MRAAGYEGIHVGQEDLSPAEVRAALGPNVLIGVSTHGESQLLSAAEGPADYVAIGPVFATLSKQVPDPVVGLEGVRAARAMTDEAAGRHWRHQPGQLRRCYRSRRGFGSGHL